MIRFLRWMPILLLVAAPLAAQEGTASPHGKLTVPCTTCHRADGWTPVRIDKSFSHAKLGFPLQGAHASANCRACHQTLDFKGTPSTCASCHSDVHRGELGPDCSRCHTNRSFLDRTAMLKAHQTTRFPLEGSHLSVDCTSCHKPGGQGSQQFVAIRTDCISCHAQNFAAAKEPDHEGGGFPRDCTGCHQTTTWGGGKFDHNASNFPLTGAHQATRCQQCHKTRGYRGTPSQCVACHQVDYDHTTAPGHASARFPTDCVACHSTASWTTTFDHDGTLFPLTGAHRTTTCTQCHGDGVYVGKPVTCVSCHQTDFNQTTDPGHVAARFPTDCLACHTTANWNTNFDHATTQFPLTGAHRSTTCAQCHGDGVYVGKPTTCVSCHQTDFNQTNDPNHVAAHFPTDCTACHTTTNWNANFNHAGTQFPLTGAHTSTPCDACHGDGVYVGKPSTCVNCHQTDYNQASLNHPAAGFSTDCKSCHTTVTWTGATFDHDASFFPIYSGKHRGKWSTCTECHTTPNNYQSFTCLQCHEHSNKASVDSDHRQVNGYQYVSTECLRCHTR